MNFDNLELVRAIDEQRHTDRAAHAARLPSTRPLERQRRRHTMAKFLHGLADRIDG